MVTSETTKEETEATVEEGATITYTNPYRDFSFTIPYDENDGLEYKGGIPEKFEGIKNHEENVTLPYIETFYTVKYDGAEKDDIYYLVENKDQGTIDCSVNKEYSAIMNLRFLRLSAPKDGTAEGEAAKRKEKDAKRAYEKMTYGGYEIYAYYHENGSLIYLLEKDGAVFEGSIYSYVDYISADEVERFFKAVFDNMIINP